MRACSVVAPELDATLAAYREQGRIDYRPVPFSPAQLDGAVLVVAATDEIAVNDCRVGCCA